VHTAGGAGTESGRAKSVTDSRNKKEVRDAYVCRVLPLTCLAPDLVAPAPTRSDRMRGIDEGNPDMCRA
jgi:hypothetical protein